MRETNLLSYGYSCVRINTKKIPAFASPGPGLPVNFHLSMKETHDGEIGAIGISNQLVSFVCSIEKNRIGSIDNLFWKKKYREYNNY